MYKMHIGFPEPATPIMEGIIDLHNYIFFYLILILILVLFFFFTILYEFWFLLYYPSRPHMIKTLRGDVRRFRPFNSHFRLEIFWTISPSIILILIGILSFALLYAMDEVLNPSLTVKVIGHQWFWHYEYSDYKYDVYLDESETFSLPVTLTITSDIVDESELKQGEHRLLKVTNPLILPEDVHIRLLITSNDVIHSWAVPSFGVKCDAVPGRLNQVFVFVKREGVFTGQCSELCGVSHAFMPIEVKVVSYPVFQDFIKKQMM